MSIGLKLGIALLLAGMFPLRVIAACVLDAPVHSCCPKGTSVDPVECHKTGCPTLAPAALPSSAGPEQPAASSPDAISDPRRVPVLENCAVRHAPIGDFARFSAFRCLRL